MGYGGGSTFSSYFNAVQYFPVELYDCVYKQPKSDFQKKKNKNFIFKEILGQLVST